MSCLDDAQLASLNGIIAGEIGKRAADGLSVERGQRSQGSSCASNAACAEGPPHHASERSTCSKCKSSECTKHTYPHHKRRCRCTYCYQCSKK